MPPRGQAHRRSYPRIKSPRSFRFVIPVAAFFGFIGWAIVSALFTTRRI